MHCQTGTRNDCGQGETSRLRAHGIGNQRYEDPSIRSTSCSLNVDATTLGNVGITSPHVVVPVSLRTYHTWQDRNDDKLTEPCAQSPLHRACPTNKTLVPAAGAIPVCLAPCDGVTSRIASTLLQMCSHEPGGGFGYQFANESYRTRLVLVNILVQ